MQIEFPMALIAIQGWQVVPAELIDIAPHITVATFVVHRDDTGMWKVSNVETGCAIGFGSYDRTYAITRAADFLAGKTDADTLSAFKRLPRFCRTK